MSGKLLVYRRTNQQFLYIFIQQFIYRKLGMIYIMFLHNYLLSQCTWSSNLAYSYQEKGFCTFCWFWSHFCTASFLLRWPHKASLSSPNGQKSWGWRSGMLGVCSTSKVNFLIVWMILWAGSLTICEKVDIVTQQQFFSFLQL